MPGKMKQSKRDTEMKQGKGKAEKKGFCECGCRRRVKHAGQRFLKGHHRRVPHGLGVTHSNKPAREFVMFDGGKQIGSIFPGGIHKPYDTFGSQQEALAWWLKNRRAYMKEAHKEYLDDGCLRPGDRPQIFWELEFGLSYPSMEDAILLLESHSLWWPGERDKAVAEGRSIPKTEFKGCLLHPCGCPIRWPSEPAVKLEDAEWYRVDCKSTSIVHGRKETTK